jgi:hypothetical protein
MKVFFILCIACCGLINLSCSGKEKEISKDFILAEKDIIPEGVAFDKNSGTIYISSTYKKKIVSIDKDGNIKDFITEGQDDIKSVIGMEVDNRTGSLWAVSSEANDVLPLKDPGPAQWRSSVYQFSLDGGKLIKKYVLDKDSVFLNDLAVADDGSVYVTESVKAVVYRIAAGSDSLVPFIQAKDYGFINGICFGNKPGHLSVATMKGIIDIDLATKNFSLIPSATGIDHSDIDGLAFTHGYFIGHQSTKVCRFYVSQDSITGVDILDGGEGFDSSTTGEIGKGYYYFIVNSQVQSGFDLEKKIIKPMDSLENSIIRKIKL